MYHSVYFGEKNTWDDWHLIPKVLPVVQPPKVKERRITVPGRNGALDITEATSDSPRFKNREGSFTFYIMHEHEDSYALIAKICAYLDNNFTTMVLEDDPGYFYRGYFWIEETSPEEAYSTLTINYNVEPYKWSFEEVTIGNIQLLEGTTEISMLYEDPGVVQEAYPTINLQTYAGQGAQLTITDSEANKSWTKSLVEGENRIDRTLNKNMDLKITLSQGMGSVSIKFRKGML